MSVEESRVVRSHRWEIAGLGRAPFRYLGMHEERHDMGGGHSKPGGTCRYCGQGILYCFRVESADGKRFVVGCDCIAHCHDPAEKIVVQAKRALKEFKQVKAREKRELSRKAEREARQARWAAEREANIARLANDPLYQRIKAIVGVANHDNGEGHGGNSFLQSMRDSMERWGQLSEKQEAAVLQIVERIESEPARKAASHWIGDVGQRVSIVGVVEFSKLIRTAQHYAESDCYLNKIRTESGAAVAWFGGYGLREGAKIEGSATIKACEMYRDERQTVIRNPRWKG